MEVPIPTALGHTGSCGCCSFVEDRIVTATLMALAIVCCSKTIIIIVATAARSPTSFPLAAIDLITIQRALRTYKNEKRTTGR